MITPERLEELDHAWNYSAFMDDYEYREWYEDLTDEERAQIDAWDKQYINGVRVDHEEVIKTFWGSLFWLHLVLCLYVVYTAYCL